MSPIAVAEAFERAPLLAERVGDGGGADAIIARARAALATMTEEERVAVLDAHPRIGSTAGLSARSAAEQSGVADRATLETLERLNEAYERRFGFRFVVFVNRRPKSEIVPILRERLERAREDELDTALNELVAIARDRWRQG